MSSILNLLEQPADEAFLNLVDVTVYVKTTICFKLKT